MHNFRNSGLDSSASLQCVGLLREIARSGRTVYKKCETWFKFDFVKLEIVLFLSFKVITSIHQPSSRMLDYFDHLYIVASGSCIYQGPIGSLVPYLQRANLNCPSYNNPADFGDYSFRNSLAHFKEWNVCELIAWIVIILKNNMSICSYGCGMWRIRWCYIRVSVSHRERTSHLPRKFNIGDSDTILKSW